MRILFITSQSIQINSSANLRNIALIKGLSEIGYEVDILSMKTTKNAMNFDKSINNLLKKYNTYYIEPIKIHNSMVLKKNESMNFVRRIKNIVRKIYFKLSPYDSLALSYKNVKHFESIEKRYDVIISSSDLKSSHLLAREYINLHTNGKCKWVQYWGDPMAIDINNSSSLPKWLLKKVEGKILKSADNIIYVSPYTLKVQMEQFPQFRNKMSFIPIGYISQDLTYKYKNVGALNIAYLGDYASNSRDIIPLYKAAKELDINLTIIGNSDIQLLPDKSVRVGGRKPYEIIRREEKNADVLICICNKTGTQLPGKIYHYSSLNKPILIIKDGDLDIENYLSKYDDKNKFYFCENNVNSIKKQMSYFKDNIDVLENGPLKAFSAQNIAKMFISEIEGI